MVTVVHNEVNAFILKVFKHIENLNDFKMMFDTNTDEENLLSFKSD